MRYTTPASTFTLTKRGSALAMRLVRRNRKMRWSRDFPDSLVAEQARQRIHETFLAAGYTVLDGEDIKLPALDPHKAWKDACIGPNADDARLVYADVLTQRRDVRGELIVAQARSEDDPKDSAAIAIAERLMRQERATFLGPLDARAKRGQVRWRRGFVDALVLERDREDTDLEALLVASLTHPSGELVRELTIHLVESSEYPRRTRVVETIATLTALAPPALETLTLVRETITWSDVHLGDLTPLFASIPRLSHFNAEGSSPSFSTPVTAPELLTMTLEASAIDEATLEVLAMSTFPRLEQITLKTSEVPPLIAAALRSTFGSRLFLERR